LGLIGIVMPLGFSPISVSPFSLFLSLALSFSLGASVAFSAAVLFTAMTSAAGRVVGVRIGVGGRRG